MVVLNTATALVILAFTDKALGAPTKRQDDISLPTMADMQSTSQYESSPLVDRQNPLTTELLVGKRQNPLTTELLIGKRGDPLTADLLIGKRQDTAHDDLSYWAKRGNPLTSDLLVGKRQNLAGQWAPTITDKRASLDGVAYNGNLGKRQLDEVTEVLDDPTVNRRQAHLMPYIVDEEKRQVSSDVQEFLDSLQQKRQTSDLSDLSPAELAANANAQLYQKREDQLADLSPVELSANNNFQLYQKRQTSNVVNDLLDSLSEKREDQLADLSPEELASNANFQIYQKRGIYDVNAPVLSIADQKKRGFMDGMVEASEGAGDVLP